jgi:general secretion pathway protein C
MALDRIVQKNFGVVVLFGAALAAFLSALGVVRIAEAAVIPDAALLAAAPVLARPTVSATDRSVTADPILSRNPFDSATGPLHQNVVGTNGSADSDLTNAPLCDDVKILIIAQSADPDWSFAALSSGAADAKTQLRRRGDEFSGKRLEFVSWDRVWLSKDGAICQADLFKYAPAAKTEAPKETSSGLDPAIAKGIRRVSAHEFQIDRNVVDKILETQSELMKVRVVPEQERGKLVGIRLFGIKPGSLLETLGFQSGDRIDSINGLEITSPESALEAYSRLRIADHLAVKINRGGSESQIDYDIH